MDDGPWRRCRRHGPFCIASERQRQAPRITRMTRIAPCGAGRRSQRRFTSRGSFRERTTAARDACSSQVRSVLHASLMRRIRVIRGALPVRSVASALAVALHGRTRGPRRRETGAAGLSVHQGSAAIRERGDHGCRGSSSYPGRAHRDAANRGSRGNYRNGRVECSTESSRVIRVIRACGGTAQQQIPRITRMDTDRSVWRRRSKPPSSH